MGSLPSPHHFPRHGQANVDIFWVQSLRDPVTILVCDLAEGCRGVDSKAGGAEV